MLQCGSGITIPALILLLMSSVMSRDLPGMGELTCYLAQYVVLVSIGLICNGSVSRKYINPVAVLLTTNVVSC